MLKKNDSYYEMNFDDFAHIPGVITLIRIQNSLQYLYKTVSINNNNIDHYPSYKYEKDGCLGALSTNEGCFVVCNMEPTDTKRDN